MNDTKPKLSLDTFCICALFSLCTIAPYQLYPLKISLLAFLILLFLSKKALCKSLYKKIGGWWALTFVVSNVFFMCLGEFYGNPAFCFYFKTEFLWFVLYSVIFLYMDSAQFFLFLKMVVLSAEMVIFLGVFAFFQFNFLGKQDFLFFESSLRPGYPFFAIAGGSVTSIIYFGALLFLFGINKITSRWLLIPLIAFIIATSRRSLMLIFILAPLFYLLLFFFFVKQKKDRKIIWILLKTFSVSFIVIVLGMIVFDLFSSDFSLQEFVDFFERAFKLSQSFEKNIDNSSWERSKQAVSLLDGWISHMILGNGIAANASIVRSEIPGMYELTYLAILFQRGIIGFLLYALELVYLIVYLIYYGAKYQKLRNFCFSFCVVLLCFLIANGTNPYLEAFDHLFYIFIPLAIIKLINQNVDKFTKEFSRYAKRK